MPFHAKLGCQEHQPSQQSQEQSQEPSKQTQTQGYKHHWQSQDEMKRQKFSKRERETTNPKMLIQALPSFEYAAEVIPPAFHGSTVLKYQATAGMRLLTEEQQEAAYDALSNLHLTPTPMTTQKYLIHILKGQ
jgi:hypothetical protein